MTRWVVVIGLVVATVVVGGASAADAKDMCIFEALARDGLSREEATSGTLPQRVLDACPAAVGATRTDPARPTLKRVQHAALYGAGGCFNVPLTTVPCDQPHVGERFATFTTSVRPSPALRRLATKACKLLFEQYTGVRYRDQDTFSIGRNVGVSLLPTDRITTPNRPLIQCSLLSAPNGDGPPTIGTAKKAA